MRIKYGDKELLESKTFIALGEGETEVRLGDDGESLCLVLDFKVSEEKKPMVKPEFVGDKTLRLTLSNWNNVIGTAWGGDIDIGVFDNRKLYVAMNVRKLGSEKSSLREVTVSFYLGEAVKNG